MTGMTKGPCSIEGCESPVKAREMCSKHYQRWNLHGNPLREKESGPGGRRPTTANLPEKECTVCHVVKPAEDYYRGPRRHLYGPCKVCFNAAAKAKRMEEAKNRPPRVRSNAAQPHGPCPFPGCPHTNAELVGIEVDGKRVRVCKTHYQQHHSGKALHPITPNKKSRINDDLRRCTICDKVKPVGAFYARSGRDGYQSHCKDCWRYRSTFNQAMLYDNPDVALSALESMAESDRKRYEGRYLTAINQSELARSNERDEAA